MPEQPGTDDHERWAAILGELWQHTRDSLVTGVTPAPWTPPEDLGPLPRDLVPRANALVESQRLAIARVRERMTDVSSRLKAVKKIPQFSTDAPVYLDRLG